jgi:HD-like signal output (HDOD) protein
MLKAFTNWLSSLFGGSSTSGRNIVKGSDVVRSRAAAKTTPPAATAPDGSREAGSPESQPMQSSTAQAGAATAPGTAAAAADASAGAATKAPPGQLDVTKPALPSRPDFPTASGVPSPAATAHTHGPKLYVEHHNRGDLHLEEKERELLARICARIAKKDLELPQLPSTSMAVIDMTSKNSAEISDIVDLIESDPVLSSELVKTANSALYSGAEAAETISQAVMRLGLRNLRTLMFSLSMRSAVLRDKRLSHYAEEVWRQSYSTASIARAIAKPLGVDPDRAFLLGLLADIGKVSLLAMLRKEIPKGTEVSPVLVGRIFYLFHETAGERLAEAWNLPPDIVAVAGCHHRYEENQRDPKDGALVSLALKLDILLTQDDGEEYRKATHAPEMEYLNVPQDQRREMLDAAYAAFTQQVTAD